MTAMELVGHAGKFGFSISTHDVFRHPGIAELAAAVARSC
jgi:hypothetical protein